MMRKTQRIEVGIHKDKVGFTLHLEDGEKEHYLFAPEVAKQLAIGLLQAVDEVQYIDRQLSGIPGDGVRISEHVDVKLTGGEENG